MMDDITKYWCEKLDELKENILSISTDDRDSHEYNQGFLDALGFAAREVFDLMEEISGPERS